MNSYLFFEFGSSSAVESLVSGSQGGIYALEQIAHDSSKYHWTIVEILSAFVREKWSIPIEKDTPEPSNQSSIKIKKVRVDVQAALTVLGRRQAQDTERKIDLRGVKISGAKLTRANLIGADLSSADLTDANLTNAELHGANLTSANLFCVDLRGCKNLTREQVDSAHYIDKSTLPDDLQPKVNRHISQNF